MSRVLLHPFVRVALPGVLILLGGCGRSGAGTERSLQDPANTAAPESSPTTNVPAAARTGPEVAAPAATPAVAPPAAPQPSNVHGGHSHATPATAATARVAPSAAASAATYACPMHPEVQKDSPGSCPKCGMNLVKK